MFFFLKRQEISIAVTIQVDKHCSSSSQVENCFSMSLNRYHPCAIIRMNAFWMFAFSTVLTEHVFLAPASHCCTVALAQGNIWPSFSEEFSCKLWDILIDCSFNATHRKLWIIFLDTIFNISHVNYSNLSFSTNAIQKLCKFGLPSFTVF